MMRPVVELPDSGAHQIIKIEECDAPNRRASGFGSISNNQDWEDDAPADLDASYFGASKA
jgi:hypothetical protein